MKNAYSILFYLSSLQLTLYDFESSANRSRDSTLRAIALTSSTNLQTFQPHLLQSVTVSILTIFPLLSFLRTDSNQGWFIKSLQLGLEGGLPRPLLSDTLASEILAYSSLPTTTELTLMEDEGIKHFIVISSFQKLSLGLLARLGHLEELDIIDPVFLFPLRFYLRADCGTQVPFPLPFLTYSIKKLRIPLPRDNHDVAFSARNFVWLMVFCETLHELSIGFNISQNDVDFLAEYKEIFKHKSNVKKLAIQFRFIASLSGTKNRQWQLEGKESQSGLSKMQKAQSLSDLLLVTKGLEAFEFNGTLAHELKEDLETQPNFEGAISSLSSSESSLRHLRRFGALGSRRAVLSTSRFILPSFKNLKMLSTDCFGLLYLRHRLITLDNVEILQLVYHYVDPEGSELNFNDTESYADFSTMGYLVEAGLLPNLKTFMIPKQPINGLNEIDKLPSRTAIWAKKRNELLSKDYFKNGRIEVIEVEAGELCECCFCHHTFGQS